jgi:hypothetical protein
MKHQTCQEIKKKKNSKYYRALTNSSQMSKTVTSLTEKILAIHFDNEETPHTVNNIVYGHFKLSLKHAD